MRSSDDASSNQLGRPMQVGHDDDDDADHGDPDERAAEVGDGGREDRRHGGCALRVGEARDDGLLGQADADAEQHQAGDGAEPDGHDHPTTTPGQEDGAQHEQDGQDDAADGDGVEGLHDALGLLEAGGLEERDGSEVVGQRHPERPLEERPAGRPERELRRVGQLGLGRDDADLLQLAQHRVDERVDVEVDDAVARLEHGRVAAQEGHHLLVQRAVGVDPHRLELLAHEDVADDLLELLLDLVGDRRGDDRRRAGKHLFQPPLDINGGDDAGGDLGADGSDDRRIVGDVGDQRGIAVAVQQDLMGPHGDAAQHDARSRPG